MSNIPDKKHSKKELSDLRASSAMQSANSPIVETYNKKLAHKGIVILGYALPFIAPFWALVKKMSRDADCTMGDFYIMAIPVVLALIIALWIALRRVLSRHNSAFIVIISLLCCFAIVTTVNSNRELKYELMSMIGKEEPLSDPLLDGDDSSGLGSNGTMTDEDREILRQETERIRREQREYEARKRAEPPSTPDP